MNNSQIIYSIIIPHYTKTDTRLLERCVKSIPERDDVEILIADNSPIEINSKLFSHRKNTTILYSDKNKGAGCARNVGLLHATGKWLVFADADDYFTEKAFEYFDYHINDSADIIYFKTTSFDDSTMQEAKRHSRYNQLVDDYKSLLTQDNGFKLRVSHFVPVGKMIKKKMVDINNITFDEVPASNDIVFGTKTGLTAKTINVDNNIVYCISVTEGSLTRTKSLKNFTSRFYACCRCNDVLKQHGYPIRYSMGRNALKAKVYGWKYVWKFMCYALKTGNFYAGNRFRNIKYRESINHE